MDRCALLVMPVAHRGRLVAMLVLENRLIRGALTTDRLEAVSLVSGQLAVSLDNAQLYSSLERRVAERTAQLAEANRRLEELSATDPLTGLPNRRRLQQALDEEWELAAQQRRPLSLAMIDIDHFKRYNDLYGHAAGDQLLRLIAAALRRTSARGDLVARYGGEEFAVVMPGSDLPAALSTARHMHEAVTAPAARARGEGAAPAGRGRGVTLSIGVATVTPAPGWTPDHLLRAADIELYRAKRQGRNRISPAEA